MNQGGLGMQPVLSTHIPLAKTESHEITEWLGRLRSNLSMCSRERGNQFWTKMDNWNRSIPEVLSSGPWKESIWKGTSVPESLSQSCAFQPCFFFLLLPLDLKTIHTAGKTILKQWYSQDATGEADLRCFFFFYKDGGRKRPPVSKTKGEDNEAAILSLPWEATRRYVPPLSQ